MSVGRIRDAPLAAAEAHWEAACRDAGCPAVMPLVEVDVRAALGEVLAAPLAAVVANPSVPVAAMDGIAIRAAAERASARFPPGAFEPVDTGQPLPPGYDAVAPNEQVTLAADGHAEVDGVVPTGANVRPAGEHLAAGQLLLAERRLLGPFDIAVAIAGGHGRVPVFRRPRVAIIPTGDEVRAPGAALEPGAVHDSNGPMIAAQLTVVGVEPLLEPRSPDDPDAIAACIEAAATRADVLLLLGGSSRGRRDHARAALERVGSVAVDGVAIRPGHPALLGVAGRAPVVGVPGYPFAAAIAVHALARPRLLALRGLGEQPWCVEVALDDDVEGRPNVTSFVPLRVDRSTEPPNGHPIAAKGSNIAALASADALLRVPPAVRIPRGTAVSAELLGPLVAARHQARDLPAAYR